MPVIYPERSEHAMWSRNNKQSLCSEEVQKRLLMVGVSDKKTQQETIDDIKSRLKEYYEVIKEAIMK